MAGSIFSRALQILAGDPTDALGAATKQYVDARVVPTDYIGGLTITWISATSISVSR